MKRDVGLKPREEGTLPPEKLREILGRIYGPNEADKLYEKLLPKEEKTK